MNRRIKAACSLLLALGLTALAGCGGGSKPASDPGPSPAPAKKEQVTIVWSYWGDPWEVELNQKVKAAFEAKNPDIKIETQHAPWANYFDKIQTQWAGGTSPDVMFLTNISLYASKGVLMDLNPVIQKNKFSLDDYPAKLLETWKSADGKLWGTPRDNDTKVFYYNKKLFDDAKVPYPAKDWTWEDMRNAALKLTKRDGSTTTQYGLAVEIGSWRLWTWMNGGELFDNGAAPTKSTLDDPKAAEAVQFLSDLINKDKVTPPYDQLKNSSNIATLFQGGKVAIAYGNAALIPTFTKITDFQWDVAPMPKAKKEVAMVNGAGGAGYTLSAKTKHPDEAFRFWSFLSSGEGQQIFAGSGLVVPATRSGQASDVFSKGKPYNVQVLIDGTAAGHSAPSWVYYPKASTLMDGEIQKALVGQITGSEATKKAAAAANDFIKNPN